MSKRREDIEEQAINIVDKLLQRSLIPTSDAVILIRAITDKGDSASAPQVYPTNIPNMPAMPNMPGTDYPWKPGIVYCNGSEQNTQQWNTTIC